MELTHRGSYAIRAVLALARVEGGDVVPARRIAKEMDFPQQDELLPYLIDQLLNMLFHSANVVEIYADDVTLRKKMTPILRRHMEVETGLDAEVRSKIKNLQEGTSAFEVEYAKVMDQIKHKRGLE